MFAESRGWPSLVSRLATKPQQGAAIHWGQSKWTDICRDLDVHSATVQINACIN
jgi:hypothetical protein